MNVHFAVAAVWAKAFPALSPSAYCFAVSGWGFLSHDLFDANNDIRSIFLIT